MLINHWKYVRRTVCHKRDHSIINNGMTVISNASDWSVSRYIIPV